MIARLHLVTDDRVLADPDFPRRARGACDAGGEGVAVHLRGPGLTARRLWDVGRELARALEGTGSAVLVNDRVDLALLLPAAGAHLGRRSLPPGAARRVLGPGPLLGRSVHEASEAAELAARPEDLEALDFLLAGTLYPTPSHPDRPGAGPERVREIREAAPSLPVLGIGGITPERAAHVLGAGAHGVAVLRAVWDARDPGAAVASFLGALEGARASGKGRVGAGVRKRRMEDQEQP